ncbi:MAG: maleylacetoacetate isomerase [Legionella sp.]|nr:maleylacetoacetate isomerase [Legionella sp.]
MLTLYDYFRSSASYRVRIALAWKGLLYEKLSIHLVKEGGQHRLPSYLAINPQGLVPTLAIEEAGQTNYLNQSLAIIEYLEEVHPNPPLLPADPLAKANVRSMALMIACEIHPLNNLRSLTYLKTHLSAEEETIQKWYHHWLTEGFNALERKLKTKPQMAPFCDGDSVTLADICLIPQIYNAVRFGFSLEPYPRLSAINAHCLTLKAFRDAAPGVEL